MMVYFKINDHNYKNKINDAICLPFVFLIVLFILEQMTTIYNLNSSFSVVIE